MQPGAAVEPSTRPDDTMNILIDRIVALSGPLPDEALHRRWLSGLAHRALEERLTTLQAEAGRAALAPRTWQSMKTRKGYRTNTLQHA